jgi:hypothetical protein
MQAGLVAGPGRIELRDVPDPRPEPQQAVVEIAFCRI